MALSCPVEDGENGDPPGVLPQVRVAYPGSCAVGPGPALLPLPARPRRLARRGGPDRQCPQQRLRRAARPAPVARGRAAPVPVDRASRFSDPGRRCLLPAVIPVPDKLRCAAADGSGQPVAAPSRGSAVGDLAVCVCRPPRLARLRGQAVLVRRPRRGVAAVLLRRSIAPAVLAIDRPHAARAASDFPVLPGLLLLRRRPSRPVAGSLASAERACLSWLRAARPCSGDLVPAAGTGARACPARRHDDGPLARLFPRVGSSVGGAGVGGDSVGGGSPLLPAPSRPAAAAPGPRRRSPLCAPRAA